jgi:DNA-binding transcriptional regulator PaaX
MKHEQTRQALFGIFLVAGRALTAPQVVALAAPLGLSASNVKSHLTRLVAEGALTREGPVRAARYAPSAHQARLAVGIRERLDVSPPPDWDGQWLSLLAEVPKGRSARERWRAWLWFDGFRPVTPGAYVRPAWPLPWAVECARAHLTHGNGFCIRGTLLGTPNLSAMQAWYGVGELHAQARALIRRLERAQTRGDDPMTAYAHQLKLGGAVAQLIARDPRLPLELWGEFTGFAQLRHTWGEVERALAARAQAFVTRVLET